MMKNSSEWGWGNTLFRILLFILLFAGCIALSHCSPRREIGETTCERFFKQRLHVATTVYDPELRHNLLAVLDSMIEKHCTPDKLPKPIE